MRDVTFLDALPQVVGHHHQPVADPGTEIEQRMVDLRHATQLLEHALQCGAEDIVTCPKFREITAGWREGQSSL
ncbi:hypothetical protein GCM10023336_52620 [Streptomyces similanensis]|uniref:MerR family transcriptional regulator n=1 Tax=Streptomyces similanensis TaxID=1274988 RepID=A0ABP9L0J4_9ACTN